MRRPRWRLMASVASVDGGGTRRWTRVGVGGSGRAVARVARGCRRVVMAVEIDGVDGGGDKGVVEMESRVEETALAVGLDATALAVWVRE